MLGILSNKRIEYGKFHTKKCESGLKINEKKKISTGVFFMISWSEMFNIYIFSKVEESRVPWRSDFQSGCNNKETNTNKTLQEIQNQICTAATLELDLRVEIAKKRLT